MLWSNHLLTFPVAISNWWFGLWEHSILSTQWWESVLQGSVGSFLALAGVLLLIRHELRREERTRKNEREKEKNNRTYENFLAFDEVCRLFIVDIEGVKRGDRRIEDLSFNLLRLAARETHGRPDFMAWQKRHNSYLVKFIGHEQEWLIAPRVAAALSNRISGWAVQDFPRDHFNTYDVDLTWKKICDQLDLELPVIPDNAQN